jgi:hypothetical protein
MAAPDRKLTSHQRGALAHTHNSKAQRSAQVLTRKATSVVADADQEPAVRRDPERDANLARSSVLVRIVACFLDDSEDVNARFGRKPARPGAGYRKTDLNGRALLKTREALAYGWEQVIGQGGLSAQLGQRLAEVVECFTEGDLDHVQLRENVRPIPLLPRQNSHLHQSRVEALCKPIVQLESESFLDPIQLVTRPTIKAWQLENRRHERLLEGGG